MNLVIVMSVGIKRIVCRLYRKMTIYFCLETTQVFALDPSNNVSKWFVVHIKMHRLQILNLYALRLMLLKYFIHFLLFRCFIAFILEKKNGKSNLSKRTSAY